MSQQYIGTGRLGATQNVAYTGTAGTVTNGVSSGVTKVRVACTTDAFIAIGDGTVAPTSTTGAPMFAGQVEYFTVSPGQKVSAIQSTANGILYVTELV